MENARNCGRGEDIKHVKDLMQSLHDFNPALTTHDKPSRGFNHPQIGRLLVSGCKLAQWDEDDEYVMLWIAVIMLNLVLLQLPSPCERRC
jgi:Family of unknown function (DUF6698)